LQARLVALEQEKSKQKADLESLVQKQKELQEAQQKRADDAEAKLEELKAQAARWKKAVAIFNSEMTSKSPVDVALFSSPMCNTLL
jgi:hypothetical protein